MQHERYPGERKGLGLFLASLRPAVEEELGNDSLLLHALRRALRSGNLVDLRRARQMFNLLPREQKRLLSSAMVAVPEQRVVPNDPSSRPSGAAWVAFDAHARAYPGLKPTVRLESRDEPAAAAVRVLVKAGTLPSLASGQLRQIADRIDADRRILSRRHWLGAEEQPETSQSEIG